MEIIFKFTNAKNGAMKYISPSTFHLDRGTSTGSVLGRGVSWAAVLDVQPNDTLEVKFGEFLDEPSLVIWRKGKIVNSARRENLVRRSKRGYGRR